MSNIYIQEPPTSGKVILHTTVGPIDIELWPRETPKACRNFVHLCLEGYYDGTKFHRVIKGMCVQGGDPTGTGEGGESIYGKPFKDEFHSRLRFVRRGLVAMASCEKNDNNSQFFFTFGATPHLNSKHTIFGKVVGDTIYNMLKLEEGGVDDEDRPEYPQKIKRAEVVENPFPDIVPRTKEVKLQEEDSKKPKTKDKTEKNFKLLSFGEEAEEEDEELTEIVEKKFRGKSKSSHDLLVDDKTLSSEPAVETANSSQPEDEDRSAVTTNITRIREKLKETSKPTKSKRSHDQSDDEGDVNVENYFEEERKRKAHKEVETIRTEYKKLKREMKTEERRREDMGKVADEPSGQPKDRDAGDNDMLASFYAEQSAYSSKTTANLKKKEKNDREAQTLALLEKFKSKMKTAQADGISPTEEPTDNWLKHELRFSEGEPVLAKDANTQKEEMFDITDPRHPLNKRKRDKDKRSIRDSKRQHRVI